MGRPILGRSRLFRLPEAASVDALLRRADTNRQNVER